MCVFADWAPVLGSVKRLPSSHFPCARVFVTQNEQSCVISPRRPENQSENVSKEKSAYFFGFYRVIAHRAVTFQAANDEPPLVRLPHTGFVRRIRARTSLTNAPPRLLVQTALAFRLRRSYRPARLPSANRKKSLASRKPAPLLTRTARLGRRTTRTCSSSPAEYSANTYTQ